MLENKPTLHWEVEQCQGNALSAAPAPFIADQRQDFCGNGLSECFGVHEALNSPEPLS